VHLSYPTPSYTNFDFFFFFLTMMWISFGSPDNEMLFEFT